MMGVFGVASAAAGRRFATANGYFLCSGLYFFSAVNGFCTTPQPTFSLLKPPVPPVPPVPHGSPIMSAAAVMRRAPFPKNMYNVVVDVSLGDFERVWGLVYRVVTAPERGALLGLPPAALTTMTLDPPEAILATNSILVLFPLCLGSKPHAVLYCGVFTLSFKRFAGAELADAAADRVGVSVVPGTGDRCAQFYFESLLRETVATGVPCTQLPHDYNGLSLYMPLAASVGGGGVSAVPIPSAISSAAHPPPGVSWHYAQWLDALQRNHGTWDVCLQVLTCCMNDDGDDGDEGTGLSLATKLAGAGFVPATSHVAIAAYGSAAGVLAAVLDQRLRSATPEKFAVYDVGSLGGGADLSPHDEWQRPFWQRLQGFATE
jgi:hypothetical protein